MRSRKQVKILRARELRKSHTRAEDRLWWLLRGRKMLGYKFRRQFLFKWFILDFYCPKLGLGLEVDGGAHSGREDYDKARQVVLENQGLRLLRFTNKEIFNEPVKVLSVISQNLPLSGLLHEVEKGDHERCRAKPRQSRVVDEEKKKGRVK